MHFCVVLILRNPGQCLAVIEAWEAAGVPGATILDTSEPVDGAHRGATHDDIALMPKLRDLLRCEESQHRTLFSVVEGEAQVQALIEASRRVIGEFDEEHAGSLFVLPVSRVYGLDRDLR